MILDQSLLTVIAVIAGGLGVAFWNAFKGKKTPQVTQQDLLNQVLWYAPTVVAAVEQEFKNSALPKEQKDLARKAKARELLVIYAKSLNLPALTPEQRALIDVAIEAAVRSFL